MKTSKASVTIIDLGESAVVRGGTRSKLRRIRWPKAPAASVVGERGGEESDCSILLLADPNSGKEANKTAFYRDAGPKEIIAGGLRG